jgi:hypothetical protein
MDPPWGMRCGRWLVCAVLYTEPCLADSGQALLKCCEPAIHGTTFVYSAPWIILCLGGSGEHGRRDCTKYEQQSHHSSLAQRRP